MRQSRSETARCRLGPKRPALRRKTDSGRRWSRCTLVTTATGGRRSGRSHSSYFTRYADLTGEREGLVKTIGREDLKEKIDRGDDFVLLEVLSEASYDRVHLPGAVRLQDRGLIPDLM